MTMCSYHDDPSTHRRAERVEPITPGDLALLARATMRAHDFVERHPMHETYHRDTRGLCCDDPPCIAGDHYPNDAGTACYYCGLPAEIVAPDELMAAWAALTDGSED